MGHMTEESGWKDNPNFIEGGRAIYFVYKAGANKGVVKVVSTVGRFGYIWKLYNRYPFPWNPVGTFVDKGQESSEDRATTIGVSKAKDFIRNY